MKVHKDLLVWQKSIALVKVVYEATASYPQAEQFGLTSQIRRSAISIPSNIAEGCGRNSDKELIQFLYISLGSASELETQIIISVELGFLEMRIGDFILKSINEIIRMTSSLIKSLKLELKNENNKQ